VVLACVRNPATGERQLNFVPRDQEVALGQQAAQDVAATMGLYSREELAAYVERVGKKLAAVSERPDLPWSFQVVDDAAVNAFALPGGYIFVTRGLLAHMGNEAQLAVVLGHEIGHVTAQHSVNQMSKAQLANLGLGLGAALSKEVAAIAGLGAQGMQLMFLKFGRDDERQADDLGLRYALKAGYDVREMPKVFETLAAVSGGAGGRLPGWLATHPEPEERVRRSEQKLAKIELEPNLERDESSYMQAVDGMTYGENPREGFFKDGTFYHPDLAFSIKLPSGFEGINTKQAMGASNEQGDAAMQLQLAPDMPAAEALRAFIQESGVQLQKGPERLGNGVAATFVGETEQGTLAGLVAFLEHRGHTFQLMGLSEASRFNSYAPAFAQSFESFSEVTDPAVLSATPKVLEIKKLEEQRSVAELAKQFDTVSLEEIALLNQTRPNAELKAGSYAKLVAPGK
jgi:predicted Zn-dependent protease